MKSIKIGLLGLGTVGCGVVSTLRKNAQEIERRCACTIDIVQAATRDISKKRPLSLEGIELTEDPFAVVNNPEVKVVLELIGGTTIARELVLQAIGNGKHVVTANKALIAMHGDEIFAQAAKRGVMVTFEAAVAGGIPIVKAIREGLCGNQIEWLAGIINGTCNFILSEMRCKQASFKDALASAQLHQYAEADPSFDIEGIDAAHKLTIMASIALGCPLKFDQVFIEGITNIHIEDIRYAEGLGYQIKHLGIVRKRENGIELRVHPTLVPQDCLLSHVDYAMNAVMVSGNAVGPTLYYGAGAGATETASAVVADLIDVIRGDTSSVEQRVPYLGFVSNQVQDIPVIAMNDITSAYYLRLTAEDKPGVMSKITGILAQEDISIEAVVQKEPQQGATRLPIVLLTHEVREGNLQRAIAEIKKLIGVSEDLVYLRVYTFEQSGSK
ncbi:MAG: homoserine dehydrogenase [Candidatus Oxydemutatoraceae bacterium WSBS_2016_MAG_OTU14]